MSEATRQKRGERREEQRQMRALATPISYRLSV